MIGWVAIIVWVILLCIILVFIRKGEKEKL